MNEAHDPQRAGRQIHRYRSRIAQLSDERKAAVRTYLNRVKDTPLLLVDAIKDLTQSFGLTAEEAGQAIAEAAEIAAQQKELRELSAEHRKQKQQQESGNPTVTS